MFRRKKGSETHKLPLLRETRSKEW